jgi:hypothetical protein
VQPLPDGLFLGADRGGNGRVLVLVVGEEVEALVGIGVGGVPVQEPAQEVLVEARGGRPGVDVDRLTCVGQLPNSLCHEPGPGIVEAVGGHRVRLEDDRGAGRAESGDQRPYPGLGRPHQGRPPAQETGPQASMTCDLPLEETTRPERLVTEAGRSSFKSAPPRRDYAAVKRRRLRRAGAQDCGFQAVVRPGRGVEEPRRVRRRRAARDESVPSPWVVPSSAASSPGRRRIP